MFSCSKGHSIRAYLVVCLKFLIILDLFKIYICLGLQPYSDPEETRRGPGDLYGLVFQNISIAAPSVLGEPDILWGMSDGLIYDLIFDNVVIGNVTIKNIDHFYHNEFVFN